VPWLCVGSNSQLVDVQGSAAVRFDHCPWAVVLKWLEKIAINPSLSHAYQPTKQIKLTTCRGVCALQFDLLLLANVLKWFGKSIKPSLNQGY